MKRNLFFYTVLIFLLLSSCVREDEPLPIIENTPDILTEQDPVDHYTRLKEGLSEIPREYPPEQAVKDGCIVILHGVLQSDPAVTNDFLERYRQGTEASAVFVNYTVEGNPILISVYYNGDSLFAVEDTTRDSFSSSEYQEFEFQFLKVFEQDGTLSFLLLNDDSITYKKYIESYISSDPSNWIDHYFLCSYQ